MYKRLYPLLSAIFVTIGLCTGCTGKESATQTAGTGTPATGSSRWIAFCEASFDSGAGNAATSDRTSWVQDCAIECSMPEWEQSCLDQAKEFGIDVGD
jgi:hypothetical protein